MVYALIPAAGEGRRLPGAVKKQWRMLCGVPLLVHTLRAFESVKRVDEVVCIVPKEEISYVENLSADYRLTKVKAVLPGGPTRQDSVRAGVTFLAGIASLAARARGEKRDVVLVHDGARPLIAPLLIEQVIEKAICFGGAVAALPVTDSLKGVSEKGLIQRSVPREGIWAMQTPQAFWLDLLVRAFHRADEDDFLGTDEAALVERMGVPIHCVVGSPGNIKVTTVSDFDVAERLIRERERSS